jgi:predicted GIY-YIG superfamily endonuclease
MELSLAIAEARTSPAVYVVGPKDRSYLYKGSARDLQQRLKDHAAGRVSHTRNRRPLHLHLARYFEKYAEARQFESYLKLGAGRDWLKTQLAPQLQMPAS